MPRVIEVSAIVERRASRVAVVSIIGDTPNAHGCSYDNRSERRRLAIAAMLRAEAVMEVLCCLRGVALAIGLLERFYAGPGTGVAGPATFAVGGRHRGRGPCCSRWQRCDAGSKVLPGPVAVSGDRVAGAGAPRLDPDGLRKLRSSRGGR